MDNRTTSSSEAQGCASAVNAAGRRFLTASAQQLNGALLFSFMIKIVCGYWVKESYTDPSFQTICIYFLQKNCRLHPEEALE
jgi:hypothetical protein